MHAMDLGVYQNTVASLLTDLVEGLVWAGATKPRRLLEAWLDYKRHCKAHKRDPCPQFEYDQVFKRSDDPCFTAHQAKAAQMRGLVFWLNDVLHRPGLPALGNGLIMRAMLESFLDFERICAQNGRFIPANEIEDLAAAQLAGRGDHA